MCVCVCVPDQGGPAGAAVQAAEVAADGGLLELLHVLQLLLPQLDRLGALRHEQLHQVEQLLHRLQGAAQGDRGHTHAIKRTGGWIRCGRTKHRTPNAP